MAVIDAASTHSYARRVLASLRAHWRILPVYVAVLWIIGFMRVLAVNPTGSLQGSLHAGAFASIDVFWLAPPLTLVAIALVEALRLRGARRAAVTVVVISAAVAISCVLMLVTKSDVIRRGVDTLLLASPSAFIWRYWWFHTAMGFMLAGYLAMREREAAMVQAARDAELARAETQRAVLDSRLKVLQARVEPELLFGVLSEAIALYPRDAGCAEALLDDLIAYLRAALPHLRRDSSTVSREVALAQAWVRIAPSLRGAVMPLACDVDARVADACFPPLILLPLVEGAVAAGARAVTLSVRAMPREGDAQHTARISVSVEAGATPAAWTGERLDALRSIVATALRGATVAVARNGARAELEVAWHLEESVRAQPLSLGSR